MSATVGPEDLLTQELLAVLQGKAPATEQWKKGYSAARTLDPDYSGSCNIPLLGAAIRLRLLGDNVDDWRDFFAASHGRWMGIETGSRIYASWHFLAVAAVAEHPKLRDAALGWLSFGVDLLRRIKEDPARREIPVIVLTVSRHDRVILECSRLGVVTYIVKPLSFENFVRVAPRLNLRLTVGSPRP